MIFTNKAKGKEFRTGTRFTLQIVFTFRCTFIHFVVLIMHSRCHHLPFTWSRSLLNQCADYSSEFDWWHHQYNECTSVIYWLCMTHFHSGIVLPAHKRANRQAVKTWKNTGYLFISVVLSVFEWKVLQLAMHSVVLLVDTVCWIFYLWFLSGKHIDSVCFPSRYELSSCIIVMEYSFGTKSYPHWPCLWTAVVILSDERVLLKMRSTWNLITWKWKWNISSSGIDRNIHNGFGHQWRLMWHHRSKNSKIKIF
jgi:hypothetical protein